MAASSANNIARALWLAAAPLGVGVSAAMMVGVGVPTSAPRHALRRILW